MSLIGRTGPSLAELRKARRSVAEGARLPPDVVAVLLDLAIATIERLLDKRPVWASVSGNYAIDTAGRMWVWADERWQLTSEGPPDL